MTIGALNELVLGSTLPWWSHCWIFTGRTLSVGVVRGEVLNRLKLVFALTSLQSLCNFSVENLSRDIIGNCKVRGRVKTIVPFE